jgi:hypothetical protein
VFTASIVADVGLDEVVAPGVCLASVTGGACSGGTGAGADGAGGDGTSGIG